MNSNSMSVSKSTRKLVAAGVTAAVYVALTMMVAPFGYGMVQCRISEVLCLLAFIDPVYGIGIVLGCLVANLGSPYGIMDVAVGTFASLLSVICISRSKHLFTATLWPTIYCVFIGALINYFSGVPFIIATLTVMAGEFLVVTVIGYPLFKYILKNEALVNKLKLN